MSLHIALKIPSHVPATAPTVRAPAATPRVIRRARQARYRLRRRIRAAAGRFALGIYVGFTAVNLILSLVRG